MTHNAMEYEAASEKDAEWLEKIASPIHEDLPCGEDERFSDDFAAIKREIEKLRENDYSLVCHLGRKLLSDVTKDLRIAGYLLMASVYVEGVSGLRGALRAYRIIIENFWEHCYPLRPEPRLSALQWLNNAKLEIYLQQYAEGISSADEKSIQADLGIIERETRSHFGEQAPVWSVLKKWLDGQTRRQESKADIQKEEPSSPLSTSQATSAGQAPPSPASASSGINSERDMNVAIREIRNWLLERNDFLQAAYFSRALRWGGLSLPPHEGGRTRIPSLRETAFNEIKKMQDSGKAEDVLRSCEKIFMEPGGQLALDIQLSASLAAEQMGHAELSEFIADQTTALIRRLPEILDLTFEDGRPFASSDTREWIKRRLSPQGSGEGNDLQDSWEKEFAAILIEARKNAGKKKLSQAIAILKNFPADEERKRLRKQLAISGLCLQAGRPELAVPILEHLGEWIRKTSLAIWDTRLAVEVWGAELEACRLLKRRGDDAQTDQLKRRISELELLLCQTDPEAAAHLI